MWLVRYGRLCKKRIHIDWKRDNLGPMFTESFD